MAVAPKVTVIISDGLKNKIKGLGDNLFSNKFANTIGPAIILEMKRLIASGQSPVNGFGRFEAYKNPDKYPGNKKKARPVNLSLTGTMLSYLSFRVNGKKLELGILPKAPQKIKVIARVHNTGERSDIAQRQFVPNNGEKFTASIQVKIKEFFRKRVLELFKA